MPRTSAEIEARNRHTLAVIASGDPSANWLTHPYHGFFSVQLARIPPFVMFSSNDCSTVRQYLWSGTFEPKSVELWIERARRCRTIIDIGANTGVYALAAAAANADANVLAFEPMLEAYFRLNTNIHANEFSNIRAYDLAILAEDGVTMLSAGRKPYPLIRTGAQTARPAKPEHFIGRASARRLDHLMDDPDAVGPMLIKIDVEGSETAVLLGAREILRERSPDILIEILTEERQAKIFALLNRLGYRIFQVIDSARLIVPANDRKKISKAYGDWNWFATKDPDFNLDQSVQD